MLHRGYLLKEITAVDVPAPAHQDATDLDRWIDWARRCRIPAFVALQKSILIHKPAILAAIEHGLSNGRIESVNTKIRLITRVDSGSTPPRQSSHWQCSASGALDHNYPAGPTHE